MSGYTLTTTRDINFDQLAVEWQNLYCQSGCKSVFMDWFWIGSWLKQVQHLRPTCVSIRFNDELVSLSLVCMHIKSPTSLGIKQAYLHRTGQVKYDQPWIEFNDILAFSEHKQACQNLLLNWAKSNRVDEFIVALTDTPMHWTQYPDLKYEIDQVEAYLVNLLPEFSNIDIYISSLSSNSRSTLRRAIRYIEQNFGEIRLDVKSGKLSPEHMQDMGKLHKLRWGDDESGSGFNNPHFVEFHEYLQSHPSQFSHVETLEFWAGEHKLGYLYNLINQDRVSFYLSAINYAHPGNRYQPGLVMHAHAIAHYAKNGMAIYDFMGGSSRYKSSLSSQRYCLNIVTLRPDSTKNRIIQQLRRVKSWLKKPFHSSK